MHTDNKKEYMNAEKPKRGAGIGYGFLTLLAIFLLPVLLPLAVIFLFFAIAAVVISGLKVFAIDPLYRWLRLKTDD